MFQDAVRDAKIAVSERATLLKKIEDLKGDLEVERSSKNKLAEKVQRRLSAAEQEVRMQWHLWIVQCTHAPPAAQLSKSTVCLRPQLLVFCNCLRRRETYVSHQDSVVMLQVNHIKTELDTRTKQLKTAQAETKTLRADAEAKLDAAEVHLSTGLHEHAETACMGFYLNNQKSVFPFLVMHA